MKRGIDNAHHYLWGDGCDGWVLSQSPDLMVIQERMPPQTTERRHYHSKARQFFYVLEGELTMELKGEHHLLTPRTGMDIKPGEAHQARNDSDKDTHFIVVSCPTTRGDRTEVS